MAEILDGAASPAQIAGFVVALRMKGETVEELVGMVDADARRLRAGAARPRPRAPSTSWAPAATGPTPSTSPRISALVVAGAGGKVCKHGNRAASSACGAADLLEALGVAIELGPEGVARCVAEAGMGFCFAPRYHPAMRHAGPSRRDLGIPTAFNILGPLSNPGRVRRYADRRGRPADGRADGRRPRRPTAPSGRSSSTAATASTSSPPPARRPSWSCATARSDLGGRPARPSGLRRADREDLVGRRRGHQRRPGPPGAGGGVGPPPRHHHAQRRRPGLVVAGLAEDLAAGIEAAGAALDSGAAVGALARLVEISQAEAPERRLDRQDNARYPRR